VKASSASLVARRKVSSDAQPASSDWAARTLSDAVNDENEVRNLVARRFTGLAIAVLGRQVDALDLIGLIRPTAAEARLCARRFTRSKSRRTPRLQWGDADKLADAATHLVPKVLSCIAQALGNLAAEPELVAERLTQLVERLARAEGRLAPRRGGQLAILAAPERTEPGRDEPGRAPSSEARGDRLEVPAGGWAAM
jgi:hypothetical protein